MDAIRIDLNNDNCCCVPTTFVGLPTPTGFTDTLLTLRKGLDEGEFRIMISLWNGLKNLGEYNVTNASIRFPSGIRIICEVEVDYIVADNAGHFQTVALAALLASNSVLTILRDGDSKITVHLLSETLRVDVTETIPPDDLADFLPR